MTLTPDSTAVSTAHSTTEAVTLTPSFLLPAAVVFLALPCLVLSVWVSAIVGLFGLFLLVQTATLRLVFTETALDVYRRDQRIRQFPYQDWQYWQIYWQSVPILFYFREIKSIHFLPILFSPDQLRQQLVTRLGNFPAQGDVA